MSLAERVGREVDPRLPAQAPSPPRVGAHQSIAASMPWFPVRARAFSLGGRNTVIAPAGHGDGQAGARSLRPGGGRPDTPATVAGRG